MTNPGLKSSRRSFLKGSSLSATALLAAGPGPAVASGTEPATIRIALASIRHPPSVRAGVEKIKGVLAEYREKQVRIVCFPETYLPGIRGAKDDDLPPPNQPAMEEALESIRVSCGENQVAAIVGLEWQTRLGLENRAFVISGEGRLLGH